MSERRTRRGFPARPRGERVLFLQHNTQHQPGDIYTSPWPEDAGKRWLITRVTPLGPTQTIYGYSVPCSEIRGRLIA